MPQGTGTREKWRTGEALPGNPERFDRSTRLRWRSVKEARNMVAFEVKRAV